MCKALSPECLVNLALPALFFWLQAARAASAPADAQQQQAAMKRLEDRLKTLQQELQEQESRVVQSEQHKQLLRESLHVSSWITSPAHGWNRVLC